MSKKVILFILFLLSLTPLLWFKDSLIIAGGDQSLFLRPTAGLKFAYLWDRFYQGGTPSGFPFHLFPFLSFFALFKTLGLAQVVAQKTWYVLLYLLPMLSMYYLYGAAVSNKNNTSRLIASIFYLFNIYFFTMNPLRSPDYFLIAAFTPLMLGFCIKGLENQASRNKYVILIGLTSLLISGVNLGLFLVVLLIFITYLIFFLFTSKKTKILGVIFFGLKSLILIFVINAWSFFAQLFKYFNFLFLSDSGQKVTAPANIGLTLEATKLWQALDATKVYEALRLMGKWNWPDIVKRYSFYGSALFVGLSYAIVIFILGAVLIGKIRRRKVFYFLFLAIFGIFLSKGSNPPLGGIYKWFYNNIPGFVVFREPYTKFTFITCLSYAVLLGIGIDNVREFMAKKRARKFFISLVPFMVCVFLLAFIWPVFTPLAIKSNYFIKVPDYWAQTNQWLLSKDEDFKIMELPKGVGIYMGFKWEKGYFGSENPSRYLLDVPTLDYRKDFSNDLIDQFYDSFYNRKTKDIAKLLSLMNVRYLHLKLDADWQRHTLSSPQENRQILKEQGINLIKKFDKSEIYEVKNNFPLIYAASKAKFFSGAPADYESLEYLKDVSLADHPVLIFTNQGANEYIFSDKSQVDDFLNISQKGKPSLEFKRINPTKYKIKVEADKPFLLVFEENFHPQWKAYAKGTQVKGHFIANGFANGYYIEKQGSYEIVLEFAPQRYFYIVILISLLVFLGGILCLLFRYKGIEAIKIAKKGKNGKS